MSYQYLVKSSQHLVQHLATHLIPAEYRFYVSGCLHPESDPLLLDAKLILKHRTNRTKSQNYRRACQGMAKVQYLRTGRHFYLLATLGVHETFFGREGWKDLRREPLYVPGGYSITWNQEAGTVVRMHREVFLRLRREFAAVAGRRSVDWWVQKLREFPFETGYAGVRDQWFRLLRAVNAERKRCRLEAIPWELCVKKKLRPEPVFLPSPPEVLEVLEHYQ